VNRIRILGVPVDAVDRHQARAFIREALARARGTSRVVAVNPEKVMAARASPELLAVLEAAELLIPDGIGVVWAARRRGVEIGRVTGVDLFMDIVGVAAESGHGVYLLGGRPGIAETAAARLRGRYPLLRVAGARSGYYEPAELGRILEDIRASDARFLALALGSPLQEEWMSAHLPGLPGVRICQGVGGTFDVVAGAVRRAPGPARSLGLEWLYRGLSQPSRWRRQLSLPRFALSVLMGGGDR
jgi:N-acetylglucosaminyldiphosphoundecaprenol N-acetyl-beta-D-mannosaminyltransferase